MRALLQHMPFLGFLDHSPLAIKFKIAVAKIIIKNSPEMRQQFYKQLMEYLKDEDLKVALMLLQKKYSPPLDEDEGEMLNVYELRYGFHPMGIAITGWLIRLDSHAIELHELLIGWGSDLEVTSIEIASKSENMENVLPAIMEMSTKSSEGPFQAFLAESKQGLSIFCMIFTMLLYASSNSQFNFMINSVKKRDNINSDLSSFIDIFEFIGQWGIPIFTLLAIVGMSIFLSLTFLRGPIRDWLDRHIPIYILYSRIQSANFLKIYSILLSAGESDLNAFLRIMKIVEGKNSWLSEKLEAAVAFIDLQHCHMAKAFQLANNGFPDKVTSRELNFYAEKAGWIQKLSKLSDQTLDSVIMSCTRLGKYINAIAYAGTVYLGAKFMIFIMTFSSAFRP